MPLARTWLLLLVVFLYAPSGRTGDGAVQGEMRPPTREQLIGAWRLVQIEYRGPSGSSVDPFYQPNSSGLLIYDASGWMSVHIVGPNRRAWEVPASRSATPVEDESSTLKSAAFDTYYTYFGTWDLDSKTSTVTHRVSSALIPAETGLSYGQAVSFENGRLIFTNHSGKEGAQTLRRKIWERVAAAR
jgi:hypothetical protein